MRAPGFWSNPPDNPGWQAQILAPASALWQIGARWRNSGVTPYRATVPVLCIGNLTAGGAGKTPMTAALMERLAGRGAGAQVVSRGYGGSLKGPHMVDPLDDTVAEVGDEPLLLAARGLVWVAKDRAEGARAAEAAGARIILMDDGFQNPGLAKDASILMVDAGQGFGNGRLIPAGPLREPVADGLARADLVVVVGPADQRSAFLDANDLGALPVVEAEMVPLQTGLILTGEPVIAFAGIARPEKFFETLRSVGANLIETHAFADHQTYAPQMLRRLIRDARSADAVLVTTEKDAVRLPDSVRRDVLTLQASLEPTDWAPIDALLERLV